jgi:hypothetical protein
MWKRKKTQIGNGSFLGFPACVAAVGLGTGKHSDARPFPGGFFRVLQHLAAPHPVPSLSPAGMPSSWTDTAWRSCARPLARPSTNQQQLLPRPSKAVGSQVCMQASLPLYGALWLTEGWGQHGSELLVPEEGPTFICLLNILGSREGGQKVLGSPR